MKILQLLLPVGMGGVERIASQLYSYSEGRDESFILIDKDYYGDFIHNFKVEPSRVFKIDCCNVIVMLLSCKKIIDKIKPDIVQTHNRKECVLACIIVRNRIIVRTQHMAENHRIKIGFIEKCLYKRQVNSWVATSNMLATSFLSKLDYIAEDKIKTIYNGASDGGYKNHDTIKNRYCVISRLTSQKGIDILLNKINDMPDEVKKTIFVDIWGIGPELEEILNLIKRYNLDLQIRYKGETNDPSSLFKEYDALLLPSRHEGLPLTMLEAMSTGTPVATHKVGCIEEFIEHKVNGWLIEGKHGWTEFFSSFPDINEYRLISLSARDTYNKLFKAETMCEKYFTLYQSLIEGKRE